MNKEPWAPDTGALLQTSSGALYVPQASAAPNIWWFHQVWSDRYPLAMKETGVPREPPLIGDPRLEALPLEKAQQLGCPDGVLSDVVSPQPVHCTWVWVNYDDLTVLPNPGIMVNKGNYPQMAARFRLVNCYNLPDGWSFFSGDETTS